MLSAHYDPSFRDASVAIHQYWRHAPPGMLGMLTQIRVSWAILALYG